MLRSLSVPVAFARPAQPLPSISKKLLRYSTDVSGEMRGRTGSVSIDIYHLARRLEYQGGFPRTQYHLPHLAISDRRLTTERETVSRVEVEKEAYLYKVALHELKTELAALRKTETAALQSASAAIQRDLDLLSLKFREDFSNMKSDVQLDWNSRKAESKEERQKNELQLQEIQHRLSLASSELKTLVEAMKLQLITKWASGIALGTTLVVLFGMRIF